MLNIPKWIISPLMFEDENDMPLVQILLEEGVAFSRVDSKKPAWEQLSSLNPEDWAGAFVYAPFEVYRRVRELLYPFGGIALPFDADKLSYKNTVEAVPCAYPLNPTRLYTTWVQLKAGTVDYSNTKGCAPYTDTAGTPHRWAEPGSKVFVRSNSVTKTLPGQVIELEQRHFEALEDITSVQNDTEVVVCPPWVFPPEREERWVVVNGKIVTGSTYMVNDRIKEEELLMSESYAVEPFIKVLNSVIGSTPYTVDVARNRTQTLLVEVNSLHCAGLYGCDLRAVVRAVNKQIQEQQ